MMYLSLLRNWGYVTGTNLECFRRTKAGESSGAGITLHMRIYALTGQRTEPGMLTTGIFNLLSHEIEWS
jgi:hypothetical protein